MTRTGKSALSPGRNDSSTRRTSLERDSYYFLLSRQLSLRSENANCLLGHDWNFIIISLFEVAFVEIIHVSSFSIISYEVSRNFLNIQHYTFCQAIIAALVAGWRNASRKSDNFVICWRLTRNDKRDNSIRIAMRIHRDWARATFGRVNFSPLPPLLRSNIWYVCTNNFVKILARGRSKLTDPALHLVKKKRGCDGSLSSAPTDRKKSSWQVHWPDGFSLSVSLCLSIALSPSFFLSVTKHRQLNLRYASSTRVSTRSRAQLPSWDLNPVLANTPNDVLPASSNDSHDFYFVLHFARRIIYDNMKHINN